MPVAKMVRALTVVFAFSSLGFSQSGPQHPAPGVTGSRLIAWSELQKPKPVPESTPGQMQRLAAVFTGVVSSGSGIYTLQTMDSSEYVIDSPEQVREHLGTRVRIVGALDANTDHLHVFTIAALP